MTTNITCYKLESTSNNSDFCLPNLKYNVFISKQTTQELSQYIIHENWGKDHVLLYKYLDYVWRFQLIDGMVKQFYSHGKQRLVFNTALKHRITNQDVFLCLVPNNAYTNKTVRQPWRVALGFGVVTNESFLSKQDLMNVYRFDENDIPIATNFLKNEKDYQFQKEYGFIIDWQERIRTTKSRIIDSLKKDSDLKENINCKELRKVIKKATKESLAVARQNKNYVGKQVFIERQIINNKQVTHGYHLELLLPLTLNIKGKTGYFAMVLRADHKTKQYEGMSILTRDMAYSNVRLIGPVTHSWLKPFVNTNRLDQYYNNINIDSLNNNCNEYNNNRYNNHNRYNNNNNNNNKYEVKYQGYVNNVMNTTSHSPWTSTSNQSDITNNSEHSGIAIPDIPNLNELQYKTNLLLNQTKFNNNKVNNGGYMSNNNTTPTSSLQLPPILQRQISPTSSISRPALAFSSSLNSTVSSQPYSNSSVASLSQQNTSTKQSLVACPNNTTQQQSQSQTQTQTQQQTNNNEYNPFFYLATTFPLTLPSINIQKQHTTQIPLTQQTLLLLNNLNNNNNSLSNNNQHRINNVNSNNINNNNINFNNNINNNQFNYMSQSNNFTFLQYN